MAKEILEDELHPLAKIEGPRSLTESVYMRLEEAIINLTIKPGEEMQEVSLAKQLGTSVTPVREALNRLAGDGLIIKGPNKRPRVVKFSDKEIEDLYDVRGALESHAIFLAASFVTSDDIAHLREIQKLGVNYHLSGETKEYQVYNANFHEAILKLSHNNLLIEMMASIMKKNRLCMASTVLIPGRSKQATEEHEEMINLLEKKDASKAQEAMRKHIELARIDVFSAIIAKRQKEVAE